MNMKESPTFASGKICYIEIPATDVRTSSNFYEHAFNWRIRERSDGSISFDDAVNEVSGTWTTQRPPAATPGFMIYIMVADIEDTIAAVREAGGEIVERLSAPQGEELALFRDPAGNVLGIYQGLELSV